MAFINGKYGIGYTETLIGTASNDTIDTKGGGDIVDGGAGTDTAVFFDAKDNFTVSTLAGITHITALPSARTTYYSSSYSSYDVVLINVEVVQFNDQSLNIPSSSNPSLIVGEHGIGYTETLTGTASNDTIDTKGGGDIVDGGAGTDTVVFFDAKDNFTVTTLAGITHIIALPSARSAYYSSSYSSYDVVLTNVENLQFNDSVVWIGPADTSAPTVTSFNPADESSGVAVGSNILLTFSEAIARGTGNIILKTAAGAVVATYDAASSGNLSISGSTLTINPSIDLAAGTSYSVEFAAGSIQDLAGNAYAGTTSYNFSTPNTPPTLTGLPITIQSITVGQAAALIDFTVADADDNNLTVTLTPTNGSLGGLTDANPSLAGIQLSGTAAQINSLLAGATFTATAAGAASLAISVTDGIAASPTIGSYNFSAATAPDTTPPTVISFSPADEATGVAVGSHIEITFSEVVTRGSGNITLKTAAGATVASSSNLSITVNYSDIVISPAPPATSTLTLNPSADLVAGTAYKVEFAAGSILDLAGNAYSGISSYNFTTATIPTSDNDTLTGTPGNDTINGLGGLDTANYNQNLAAYTVLAAYIVLSPQPPPTSPALASVADLTVTGPEGNDTLTSIERLHFADINLAFDIDANAGQVYRLYQAAFNRTPDVAGLGGWIAAMDNGTPLLQIASSFMASAEFQSLYGTNPSNEAFVSNLYTNALHRPAQQDAGSAAGWVSQLASNQISRVQALVNFSESTENKASVLPAIASGIIYATAEQATGSALGLVYSGSANADNFIGTVGKDNFTGGAGNDSIEGGRGLDTAIYSANQASYTVTQTSTGLSVTDDRAFVAVMGGPTGDGTDTLSHVERLQFADGVLAFDIDGNAGQTYRLYQAAFNRTPDKLGLSGWVHGMDNGLTLNQMATEFIRSPEFFDRYGANTSNAEFVDLLYNNALHRTKEVGDNYWMHQLDRDASREQALIGLSESAENQVALMGVIEAGIDLTLPV